MHDIVKGFSLSMKYQLGYPAQLGNFIVSSVSLFCPSISMSLLSISLSLYFPNLSFYLYPLSLYFAHLSLSSISVSLSPPPLSFQIRNSLLQVGFPALDPSLATTHLHSRYLPKVTGQDRNMTHPISIAPWMTKDAKAAPLKIEGSEGFSVIKVEILACF